MKTYLLKCPKIFYPERSKNQYDLIKINKTLII